MLSSIFNNINLVLILTAVLRLTRVPVVPNPRMGTASARSEGTQRPGPCARWDRSVTQQYSLHCAPSQDTCHLPPATVTAVTVEHVELRVALYESVNCFKARIIKIVTIQIF